MSDQTTPEVNIDTYIGENIGPGTHRSMSEEKGTTINFQDARKAGHVMKTRLNEVYRGFSDTNFDAVAWQSEENMENAYNASLRQVSDGDPIVDNTKQLKDYLQVDTARHPAHIKEELMKKYGEGTIPRAFLTIMQEYEDVFNISPAEAAALSMKHVTASLPQLEGISDHIKNEQNIAPEIATRLAFQELQKQIFVDIQAIKGMLSSNKTKMASATMATAHFLLGKAKPGTDTPREGSVLLSKDDKEGLIEAYHIQDRPYSQEEVQLASKILNGNSHLRSTLIAFQQMFIDYSASYLQRHPERLKENLKPYNPIFIPTMDNGGQIIGLAPNPKLIKSICNNWLPAIARHILDELPEKTIDEVEPSSLTSEHIKQGITKAEKSSIFSSIIGEFRQTDNPNVSEWVGTFPIACPAKNMFTQSGVNLLPNIYDYVQTIQQ